MRRWRPPCPPSFDVQCLDGEQRAIGQRTRRGQWRRKWDRKTWRVCRLLSRSQTSQHWAFGCWWVYLGHWRKRARTGRLWRRAQKLAVGRGRHPQNPQNRAKNVFQQRLGDDLCASGIGSGKRSCQARRRLKSMVRPSQRDLQTSIAHQTQKGLGIVGNWRDRRHQMKAGAGFGDSSFVKLGTRFLTFPSQYEVANADKAGSRVYG